MQTPPPTPFLRLLAQSLSIAGFAWLAGCSEPTTVSDVWTVQPLASGIAAGSQTPYLSSAGDGAVLSWWASEGDETVLRFARFDGETVTGVKEIVRGTRFFVNWADFPSITQLPSGRLVAHWLQRGDAGGYDYGVRVSTSTDGGDSWDAPWTPHEDGTPAEHGFVSIIPEGEDGFTAFWLDGRQFAASGHDATNEMTLRTRSSDGGMAMGPDALVDDLTCDCCQTDAAWTSQGPMLVYRNRTREEIRDIYYTQRRGDEWTEAQTLHDDNWEIAACPVNGPAIAADGDHVVVTWFTAAAERPMVQAKISTDGGLTFGPALRIDHGNPSGRVDVVALGEGRAMISWLERVGGRGAEVRMQELNGAGFAGDWVTLAGSSSARASGFPRLVALDPDRVFAAWTDVVGDDPQLKLALVTRER